MTTTAAPTQDDLKKQIKDSEIELEKAIKEGDTDIDKDESGDVDADETQSDKDESSDADDKDTSTDDAEDKSGDDQADDSKDTKDPDYKEKFKASSRESQKIYAGRRKVNEAIVQASKLPEPTQEELVAAYPEWEDMTDTEKKLARSSYIGERRFNLIEQASVDAEKIEKWNDQVQGFVEDPQSLIDNPELDGKEDAFKEYALNEENRNVPIKVLVSSFLFEHAKAKPPKKKGKMFEQGNGGPSTKTDNNNSGKISLDESRKLMKTNYNEYKRLLKAGKIDITV